MRIVYEYGLCGGYYGLLAFGDDIALVKAATETQVKLANGVKGTILCLTSNKLQRYA